MAEELWGFAGFPEAVTGLAAEQACQRGDLGKFRGLWIWGLGI